MKITLLCAFIAALTALPCQAVLLTFDSGPVTAGTGTPLPTLFTMDYAFLETDGEDGPLLTPSWTAYPGEPALSASPLTKGYGTPVSDPNALDAVDSPVLITFDTPVDLSAYSTILDNSPLGDIGASIQFFDAADLLIASIPLDQNAPGFVATLAAPVTGVKKIVLPSNALYDNMDITAAVPEAGSASLAAAAGMMLLRRRHRR